MDHIAVCTQRVSRALLPVACMIVASGDGFAQDATEASQLFDDHDYIGFEAIFGLEVRQDDNIFTTDDQATSSFINAEMVELRYAFEPSDHRFEFDYTGEFAQYQDSDDDDYADHGIGAQADISLSANTGLSLAGTFDRGHQDRGSGLSAGLGPGSPGFPPEPDEYDLTTGSAKLIFGSRQSTSQVELDAAISDLEFQNNLDRTQFFSRQYQYAGGTFYYRYLPKTSFLIDARFGETEYDNAWVTTSTPDNSEVRSRVGIQWDATAKTTGYIKAGYLAKDFDADDREDFSGFSWAVDLTWSPRTYSHFNMQSAREPRDTTDLLTDYIDSRWVVGKWTHEWSQNWLTALDVGFSDDEFVGTPRTEELSWVSFEIDFKTSSRLVWYFAAQFSSQESSLDQFAYDDDIYRFGVRLQAL